MQVDAAIFVFCLALLWTFFLAFEYILSPLNAAALSLQLVEYQHHPVDDPDYYNCDCGYCLYPLILLVFQFQFTHFKAFTTDFWGRNVYQLWNTVLLLFVLFFCWTFFSFLHIFWSDVYLSSRICRSNTFDFDIAENFMRCLHWVCSSRSPFPLLFELVL